MEREKNDNIWHLYVENDFMNSNEMAIKCWTSQECLEVDERGREKRNRQRDRETYRGAIGQKLLEN